MFIGFEVVTADSTVKDATAFTIPAEATRVVLQCESFDVRYTMDNATNPTSTSGMILRQKEPQEFLIEDLKRIKFTVDGGGLNTAPINVHYVGRS